MFINKKRLIKLFNTIDEQENQIIRLEATNERLMRVINDLTADNQQLQKDKAELLQAIGEIDKKQKHAGYYSTQLIEKAIAVHNKLSKPAEPIEWDYESIRRREA